MSASARPTGAALLPLQRVARALAWLAVGALVVVTLAPLGVRPVTAGSAHLERFGAYFIAAALFAFAYRQHLVRSMVCMAAVAVLLELLQTLTPDRHGHLSDAAVKLAGVGLGFLAVNCLLRVPRLAAHLRRYDQAS